MTQSLDCLLANVDYIYAFIFTGGEAFLHPELDQIIRQCADSGKAGDISIQSNGTIIPSEKVLAALRHAKALVKISNYPGVQPNVEKLKLILDENNIRYTHASGTFWNDQGPFGQRQEGLAEAAVRRLCATVMHALLQWKAPPLRNSRHFDGRGAHPGAER